MLSCESPCWDVSMGNLPLTTSQNALSGRNAPPDHTCNGTRETIGIILIYCALGFLIHIRDGTRRQQEESGSV
ncbi:uncharacterized [Tachysurus ichikawai]